MSTHELEIAEVKRTELAAIEQRQPSVMDIIGRAVTDPNMDVDKLERLIALSERAQAREAEQTFNKAMTQAQKEMRPVAADANNPQTKSKYASYFALDRALRPIYTKHGFSLSYDTGEAKQPDYIQVLCYVSHDSGHSRTYHIDMPADGKGAKGGDVMTKTHAVGAGYSYGQRYLLKGIFNISVGDDQDGNAVDVASIDADQMQHILDQIDATGSDIEQFCKFMGVEAIKHITMKEYGRAIQALNAKARKVK